MCFIFASSQFSFFLRLIYGKILRQKKKPKGCTIPNQTFLQNLSELVQTLQGSNAEHEMYNSTDICKASVIIILCHHS